MILFEIDIIQKIIFKPLFVFQYFAMKKYKNGILNLPQF